MGKRTRSGFMTSAGWLSSVAALRVTLLVLAVCLGSSCSTVPEPTLPSTDLFLVEIEAEEGSLRLGRPVNLTDREGYDSQPCFLPDGDGIVYVARNEESTDIYVYDLARRASRRLTHTSYGREYSPQPIPGAAALSMIRVERDGRFRLLRFDRDGVNPAPIIAPAVGAISYYAWIDADTVAIVSVEARSWLSIVDVTQGTIRAIAADVGRSIQKVPGRSAVSFVRTQGQDDWWIEVFDAGTGETTAMGPTLPGREEHAWLPDGRIVMGRDGELFTLGPEPDATWTRLADLTEAGLRDITRIAVAPSGDRLVLVAEDPATVSRAGRSRADQTKATPPGQ